MLLEAKKLDKSFNGVYALKGLDLSLKEGEIHGLVGENGAGKCRKKRSVIFLS